MPKEIVLTGIGNRIENATTNGKGIITGKREDITDQCIDAVYAHLKTAYERSEKPTDRHGYLFKDGGKLMYIAPEWKRE